MNKEELLNKVFKLWKESEDPAAAVAYTECYFLILEYIQDECK